MEDLFKEVGRRNALGQTVAMATIVGSRGSTPRKAGTHMLVFEDGSGMGTVGGGCVEADVWREAAHALADGNPRLFDVDLVDDFLGEGDVCGGTVEVFVDLWRPDGSRA
jgi:xanthine/CO dehydrogenase XdhC/CoxF family maturation factor